MMDDKSAKYVKTNKINFVTCIILTVFMMILLIVSIFKGEMAEAVGCLGGLAVSVFGIRQSYNIVKIKR
ncbi:hypothetical protein [Clostridium lacusfryxellense]|uniref:hypothetical protein n=1 Tax=Clostridium lacusfryxellense TaxID=205328 RepID=UPI001C0C8611|nr:hypothetical protein [Clostridium lacusfryxellense]MBU3111892.1 hypothetical protein [Clostridium lacusfryxellense]